MCTKNASNDGMLFVPVVICLFVFFYVVLILWIEAATAFSAFRSAPNCAPWFHRVECNQTFIDIVKITGVVIICTLFFLIVIIFLMLFLRHVTTNTFIWNVVSHARTHKKTNCYTQTSSFHLLQGCDAITANPDKIKNYKS